jgi:ADP-ribosyl-[dinitrogen reductase] hydrolase
MTASNLSATLTIAQRLEGALIGCAVGDALGLPSEGLSPQRIRRRWRGNWKMRLIFGRGMISDDTEHTFMVASALASHSDDVRSFQRSLAWKLRAWFAALPPGTGMATAKACMKLWLGFGPDRSGVYSAGNGPAMRSAIIGVHFNHSPEKRREFVRASTRLTHTDPKAETAALAVAECAAWSAQNDSEDHCTLLAHLRALSAEPEWHRAVDLITRHLTLSSSVSEFADAMNLSRGVTGYAFHTVPVAIYSWLRHPSDFRTALVSVLACGGDTDTAGAHHRFSRRDHSRLPRDSR